MLLEEVQVEVGEVIIEFEGKDMQEVKVEFLISLALFVVENS